MTLFLQQLANGLALGSVYAIFAVGFSLVFSSLGILNLAHGMFSTWAALIAYYCSRQAGLPLGVAIMAALLGAALLGVLLDKVAFETMRRRDAGVLGPLMTSFGAWIALRALAELVAGPDVRGVSSGVLGTRFQVGNITLQVIEVICMATAIAVTFGLHVAMKRTRLGLAVRAVGWDEASATVSGINSKLILSFTVALSAVIAGLAGIYDSFLTSSVSPELGETLLLTGFAAVVVGGVGDVRGALMGGLIIGISEVLGAHYLGGTYKDALTYGLLLLFLLVRPRGILGEIDPVRA